MSCVRTCERGWRVPCGALLWCTLLQPALGTRAVVGGAPGSQGAPQPQLVLCGLFLGTTCRTFAGVGHSASSPNRAGNPSWTNCTLSPGYPIHQMLQLAPPKQCLFSLKYHWMSWIWRSESLQKTLSGVLERNSKTTGTKMGSFILAASLS